MRKFLVTPDKAVEFALAGILAVNRVPLERVEGHFGLVYRGNKGRRVRILVGGGSGHEPLFLGAVGPGMADGAVAGAVFAAPNPLSIQTTAEALGEAEGIVYLYGNYSGDVLNFDFAAEELETKAARSRRFACTTTLPPRRRTEWTRAGEPPGIFSSSNARPQRRIVVCLWRRWCGWARK
jgi:dihydroxyacetone kinase